MATNLNIMANEESALVITCVFRDEDGELVVPDTITWALTTSNGTIINEREDVEVVTPASSIDILLSGNDLAVVEMGNGISYERRITIQATYTSDLGAGIPLKAEAKFLLSNFVVIS